MQYERPLLAEGVTVTRMQWVPRRRADVVGLSARLLVEARRHDVVVLCKPHLHPSALHALRRANPRIVVDLDDAIWTWPTSYAARFEQSAAAARAISAGSGHLARIAAARYPEALVERIPTVVDTDEYAVREPSDGAPPVVVGWIGNTPSLEDFDAGVIQALTNLTADGGVIVRVVCAHPLERDGLEVEFVPWSIDTEVETLRRFDVGIMPLHDDERARGRCGLKAIQYMAVGIPVVASPVGAATEIIQDGRSGLLARTAAEWTSALSTLVASAERRAALGAEGRRRVEGEYSVAVNVPRLIALWERVAHER
jgi:glycosyltransferase involved in cell wall biosynthesis